MRRLVPLAEPGDGKPDFFPRLTPYVTVTGMDTRAQTVTYVDTTGEVVTPAQRDFIRMWDFPTDGAIATCLSVFVGVRPRSIVF